MALLIIGFLLFFGTHLAPLTGDTRERAVHRLGERRYKVFYSLVAMIGLVLMIWGYATAPYINVWTPPLWTRHLALLLMIPALTLAVMSDMPSGRVKAAVRHPLLAGVKIWAFAHLLANGDLASILLFGGFLGFGVIDRISLARRERAGLVKLPVAGPVRNDLIATAIALALYVAIVLWLHPLLIGVPVLP